MQRGNPGSRRRRGRTCCAIRGCEGSREIDHGRAGALRHAPVAFGVARAAREENETSALEAVFFQRADEGRLARGFGEGARVDAFIQQDNVVGVIACQRERTTAILIERMREPLNVSEAIDLLRA